MSGLQERCQSSYLLLRQVRCIRARKVLALACGSCTQEIRHEVKWGVTGWSFRHWPERSWLKSVN